MSINLNGSSLNVLHGQVSGNGTAAVQPANSQEAVTQVVSPDNQTREVTAASLGTSFGGTSDSITMLRDAVGPDATQSLDGSPSLVLRKIAGLKTLVDERAAQLDGKQRQWLE